MDQRNESDVLKGEKWDGLYADVPDAVVAGMEAAFARIHRRERRGRFALRALACAAGLALIVGVAGLTLGREKDMTDRVAAPSASLRTLREDEIVYSAPADACFHLRKDCSRAEADQVALQLVTALEFEKQLCPACGGNVLLP